MMIKYLLILLIMLCNLKADNVPLELEVGRAYNEAYGFFYPKLIITSLINNIEIKSLSINKGNCNFADFEMTFNKGFKSGKLLPKKLNSYQDVEVRVDKECRVKIVDIDTNKGSYYFKF